MNYAIVMKKERKTLERFTRAMFTEIMAALCRTLQEQDYSVAQVALLHLLDRGPMSSKDAAARLALAAPAMSRLADDLVKRNMLTRTEAAEDRRVRMFALTPAGQKFLDRISESRVAQILETVGGVPEEGRAAVIAAMGVFLERREQGEKP
jgi:DNA-binding MarR family transcriptional regulator